MSMEKIYAVDFELEADSLVPSLFKTLHDNQTIWGHQVKEPLFAIKHLHVSSENAKICGKNHNTIQLYDEQNDIKYVMFNCDEHNDLYQWISNNWEDEELDVTIIGTLGINQFESILYPQVIINDLEIQNTIGSMEEDKEGW